MNSWLPTDRPTLLPIELLSQLKRLNMYLPLVGCFKLDKTTATARILNLNIIVS